MGDRSVADRQAPSAPGEPVHRDAGTLLLLELVTSSLLFLLLPLLLLVLALPDLAADALAWPGFGDVHTVVAAI